jgi:hypothetical protein
MVRFKVLTAISMKMAVFWDVALCSLVEAVSSKMSVNIYQNTQHNIPEDSHLPFTSYLHFSFNFFIYSCITFQTTPFHFLHMEQKQTVSGHSNISGGVVSFYFRNLITNTVHTDRSRHRKCKPGKV